MGKIIGCVYKDFAKVSDDHYYDDITVEKFDDRGFDYLLTQGEGVIGLTEKQFFTLYMEMKQEIDRINTESHQGIPEPPPPPPTRQVKCSKLIPDKVKYPDQLDTPADLSEHSTESLEEELKLLELDKKDIQAELRKRKKTDNSNGQVDKA